NNEMGRTLPVRRPQLGNTLFHDADRLAHLFHADAVAVVTIAVLADRDVEIQLRIALVRLDLAQVPGGAATAHHHARETPSPGVGERNYADVHVAVFEDAIVSQQTLDIVAHLQEWVAERLDIVDQFWRKVLMYAADAEIGGMHAAAGGALVEPHELFTLLKAPERRRERAHVHGLGGDIEQMRKQPSDFAIEDADELRATRDRDAQKLFRRQAERMLLVHRRDIVEAVEIRDRLQIGFVLDQLLGAAMKQADMRIDPLHHLAVEFKHGAQDGVRGRMLGAEIDREITLRRFRHGGRDDYTGTTYLLHSDEILSRAYMPVPRMSRQAPAPGSTAHIHGRVTIITWYTPSVPFVRRSLRSRG